MEKASDSAGEFSPDTAPGRMAESDGVGGPTIKINVSYGSSLHELHLPAQSTFGDIKKLLAHKTGLEPEEQRLFFRGIEKDDKQILQLEGVKDKSKIFLLEVAASKENKLEETRKLNEMFKASEAITGIRAEVDKLSDRVTALEVSINAGNKVSEKEFLVLTELLMSQLLKLDGIEAEGEAKLQRKAEDLNSGKTIGSAKESGGLYYLEDRINFRPQAQSVRRVQSLVDALDSLKTRNSNPFSHSDTAVTVTTQWETFDTGTDGSNDPSTASSSTKTSQDWERFD